eukprot:scaffold89099_cov20-Tisochrysis_lutea.AAC.2
MVVGLLLPLMSADLPPSLPATQLVLPSVPCGLGLPHRVPALTLLLLYELPLQLVLLALLFIASARAFGLGVGEKVCSTWLTPKWLCTPGDDAAAAA